MALSTSEKVEKTIPAVGTTAGSFCHTVVWVYLLFFNLHYAYRYIFKYNSETTSPTYSDTPFAIQIIKYLVFAGAMYIISLYYFASPDLKARKATAWVLLLCFYFTSAALVSGEFSSPEFVKAFLLPVYPFCILFFIDFKLSHFKNLRRLAVFIFWFHLLYSGVQVALFFIVGRLPALGYENSLLVRFGGGLDDPNGFAPLIFAYGIFLFDSLSWGKFSWGRTGLLCVCLILFIWTMSFTAFITAVPCFILYLYMKRSFRLIGLVLAVCSVTLTSVLLSPLLDIVLTLYEMKMESASEHFRWSWSDFFERNPLNQVFGTLGSWKVPHIEGDLVFHLFNYGWIGIAILTGFWFVATRSLYHYFTMSGNQATKSMVAAAMAYLFMIFAGTWNLPYLRLAPINMNYWFIIFVVLSQDEIIRRLLGTEAGAPHKNQRNLEMDKAI